MVDHFHEQVAGLQKIGGQARAMVVTSSIQRAISYYYAIRDYLAERKSPYRAIAAFSGEHEYERYEGHGGIPQRLLVERDRRQDSGGALPLLGLRRQVPDRLRRAAAAHNVRGQDFVWRQGRANAVASQPSSTPRSTMPSCWTSTTTPTRSRTPSADYYRTTVLAEETDPDRLHDLKAVLDGYQVYAAAQLDELVERYLSKSRPRLNLIPSWTPVSRSTGSRWTKMAKWTSRARPRRSSGPTGSWPQFCPTLTPSGRSSPSS